VREICGIASKTSLLTSNANPTPGGTCAQNEQEEEGVERNGVENK